jgi:hypothetical protein
MTTWLHQYNENQIDHQKAKIEEIKSFETYLKGLKVIANIDD